MSDTVEFEGCECRFDSDKAIRVRIPELDRSVWIPRSQIDDDSEVYKRGTEGTLIVSEWFATKEGLI